MMHRGLMLIASAFSFSHVDEFYIILDARFHVDQVVRDEFMNDTDAESQALAAQCLQVLLPARCNCSMPYTFQRPCCIAVIGQTLWTCFHKGPQNGPWFCRGEVCMMRLHEQTHTLRFVAVCACQAVLHAADASSARAAGVLLQSLTPPVAALKPLELAMQASALQICNDVVAQIDRQSARPRL
jgi:hypothetical protein